MKQLRSVKSAKVAEEPAKKPMLQVAHETINGARQNDYGDKLLNFSQISMLWTALFSHKLNEAITPEEVAMAMIQVKLSRLVKSPGHKDSWLDVAGYSGCADILQDERDAGTVLPGVMQDYGKAE